MHNKTDARDCLQPRVIRSDGADATRRAIGAAYYHPLAGKRPANPPCMRGAAAI